MPYHPMLSKRTSDYTFPVKNTDLYLGKKLQKYYHICAISEKTLTLNRSAAF